MTVANKHLAKVNIFRFASVFDRVDAELLARLSSFSNSCRGLSPWGATVKHALITGQSPHLSRRCSALSRSEAGRQQRSFVKQSMGCSQNPKIAKAIVARCSQLRAKMCALQSKY